MKYEFIKTNSSSFHVEKMCHMLEVSRRGFYSWNAKPIKFRPKENELLVQENEADTDESSTETILWFTQNAGRTSTRVRLQMF